MTDPPFEVFRQAAIRWAAGGRGQPLVDAAALALADGLDTPTLRQLAGAPHIAADDEATELAPDVFAELGLDVAPRLSEAAIIAGARQLAREFLESHSPPRDLAGLLWRSYVEAGYPSELAEWAGYDDYYGMLEDGIIAHDIRELDREVVAAANRLANSAQ